MLAVLSLEDVVTVSVGKVGLDLAIEFTSDCVVLHLQLCCVASSLYWATTTLATVGYGDITASNTGGG